MKLENLQEADFKFRQHGCCYETDSENKRSKIVEVLWRVFWGKRKRLQKKNLGFSFEMKATKTLIRKAEKGQKQGLPLHKTDKEKNMQGKISIHHGSGGGKSRELIENLFRTHFSNPVLDKMDDAGVLKLESKNIAFTTDSFVVKPIFFEGGDIGRLAISGTVNDLAVMGAKPCALTVSFIIEESFEMEKLRKIVVSMKETADEAGVIIAAGDTKVVEKGSADGIFITTSGIGIIPEGIKIGGAMAKPGDVVILSGSVGNHGASIITSRKDLGFKTFVKSDVAPLNNLIERMIEETPEIHVMRDATRGGLATVLNEIAIQSGVKIEVLEEKIPVKEEVKGVCGLLGLDPLYLANEGRIVVFVKEEESLKLLDKMRESKYGRGASVIGRVVDNTDEPVVILKTVGSGGRILDMLSGEPLPRIC